MTLTRRQSDVFQFIKDWLVVHQCTPTVREICGAFGIESTNGAVCHLTALEKRGLIKRIPGEARNIRLLGYDVVLKKKEVA